LPELWAVLGETTMPFMTDLVVRQIGDDDWQLVERLVYEGNRHRFTIPIDSKTDFASVPAPLRWLIPKSGRHSKAAVLHDFLWRSVPMPCSYSDADGLFRRALYDLHVPLLRRWLMWAGVRWASLFKTGFRDGPEDLLQLLPVTAFPGLFVLASGVIVLFMLLAFGLLELVAGLGVLLLRTLGARQTVKELRVPALVEHAQPTTRPAAGQRPTVHVEELTPGVAGVSLRLSP
jgi:hypothetical protein